MEFASKEGRAASSSSSSSSGGRELNDELHAPRIRKGVRAASVGVVQGALRRVNGGLLEPGAVSRTRSSGDPIICKKLGKDPALLATLFESDACLPWVGNFRAPASMSPSQL